MTSTQPESRQAALFKRAAWLRLERTINQYLMANAHGRWDGALKAHAHREMCCFYLAVYLNCEESMVLREHDELFRDVHRATQDELTDYLDEVIGFPRDSRPDYDTLAPKFFEVFHNTVSRILEAHNGTQA